MNILFLWPNPIVSKKGGVQRVTSVLSAYFEKNGDNVYFLASTPYNDNDEKDSRQFFFPDQSKKDLRTKKNIVFFNNLIQELKISHIINQGGKGYLMSDIAYFRPENVKLISCLHHAPLDPASSFPASMYSRFVKYNIKWLMSFVDYSFFRNIAKRLYRIKYKKHFHKLCRNSDRVFLLSPTHVEEMAYYFGGKLPENVLVMPNPVPEEIYNYASDDIYKGKQKIVLYVGRINFSQKRVDLLIKIWAKVCADFPDWKLVVVGDGEERRNAEEIAKKLNCINICFEGFQPPATFYNEASILCMTSSYEGFGMVLIEAACQACIPIAFDSYSAVRDIIKDGDTGYLITPYDCDAYASKLKELFNNLQLREQIANNAREDVERFSLESIGKKWDSILNNL